MLVWQGLPWRRGSETRKKKPSEPLGDGVLKQFYPVLNFHDFLRCNRWRPFPCNLPSSAPPCPNCPFTMLRSISFPNMDLNTFVHANSADLLFQRNCRALSDRIRMSSAAKAPPRALPAAPRLQTARAGPAHRPARVAPPSRAVPALASRGSFTFDGKTAPPHLAPRPRRYSATA